MDPDQRTSLRSERALWAPRHGECLEFCLGFLRLVLVGASTGCPRHKLPWSVDAFPAVRAGSECSHVPPITIHGPWNVTADADPHSCRPRGHTAHRHQDQRRDTEKLNHNVAKAAATGSLCSAPSTCKRSGQLAPSARQRAACRAYSLRRLDEEEEGGLDELSGELRRNRGAGAAEDLSLIHI